MTLHVKVTEATYDDVVAELTIECVEVTADEEIFSVRATVDRGSATGIYQYPIYVSKQERANPLGLLRHALNEMPLDHRTMEGDVVYSSSDYPHDPRNERGGPPALAG